MIHVYTESHKNENKFTNEIFEHEDDTKQVLNTKTKPYYWIGKDYANTYREDFKDIHEFSRGIILRLNKRLKLFLLIQTKYINYHFTDQFDRETIPRMPWRDQALFIVGEAARDVARHFIHRWNHCKVI